ncbi:MAG: hypothetical protein MZV63_10630 [Marinilabiliales bacterium]|nr:hypothetical protein [Marinilabiliales bacterium]
MEDISQLAEGDAEASGRENPESEGFIHYLHNKQNNQQEGAVLKTRCYEIVKEIPEGLAVFGICLCPYKV